MKNVPVKMGHFRASKRALVDDEDYEKVMGYKWKEHMHGYAVADTGSRSNGTRKWIRMHHLIAGKAPNGKVTDHINGNPLDNRKDNLRFCTQGENLRNTKIRKDNKSGHKGVYFVKRKRKFCALITVNGNTKYLGEFVLKDEAAEAYIRASEHYHGNFRRLA